MPPRWVRLVGFGLGGIAVYSAAQAGISDPAERVAVWGATLLFIALYFIGQYRPIPLLLLAEAGTGVVLQAYTPNGIGFLVVIVSITQMTRLELWTGRVLALVAGLSYISVFIATAHPNAGGLLSLSTGLVFAFIGAGSVRRLSAEKQRTEALLQEVVAGREARIQAAALDERSRLAREIHDILAHTLSALSIQLESTQLLLEQRPGDPAGLAAVERAARLAKEGLGEARRAVGALRGDDLPGPELLPRLAEDFQRDTGISCRLTVEGEPVALPPEARLALYRTAQEALTNIRKHASASAVELHLRYGAGGVELTVENNGVAAAPENPGGHGLIGMRERAELAHGRLEAGPIPSGFRVHLALPS
jgi:signal transduction histidine kinase